MPGMIDKMMGKAGIGGAPGGMPPVGEMPVDGAADEMGIGGADERGAVEIFDSVSADLQLLAERVPEIAGLARRLEALRPAVEAADGGASPEAVPGEELPNLDKGLA